MNLSTHALAFAFAAAMCGCATNLPQAASTKTTAAAIKPAAEPAPAAPAVEPVATPAPAPVSPAPAEAAPEKCTDGWVCVKVNMTTGKVEKRATKLLGDPKIEGTWSKQSDGRTASFDEFKKGPVQLTLRRKPNNKNDVVVRLAKGGPTIVVDRHDGSIEDFTHVGAIAAEQDGALLLDVRYMR